jgi:hypothetical protein
MQGPLKGAEQPSKSRGVRKAASHAEQPEPVTVFEKALHEKVL